MATKKRMKRFDEGGMTSNSNYPFGQGQSQMQAPAQDSGGLGNTSPLVQVNATPFGMKKGGSVSTSKVKKMAVGGMGGMERKPVGPAMGRTPVGPGFKSTVLPTPPRGPKGPAMELKPIGGVGQMPGSGFGGSTVLPTPPRGPKGPAMELKPIGGARPVIGFPGGPGGKTTFGGGMEQKPVGGMIGMGSMSPQLASKVGSQLLGGMEQKPVGGNVGFGSGGSQLNPAVAGLYSAAKLGSLAQNPGMLNKSTTNKGFADAMGSMGSRVGSQLMGGMKKGGAVKKMASGGSTSSASSRADGIAQKGKTRGKMR